MDNTTPITNIEKMESFTDSDNKKEPIVSLKGIYKIFKQGHLEVIALKNINLDIYPGELIVIMGPSGSGKTTLLNVISGMEKPNAGSVLIRNLEVTRLKDEGIQKLLQHEIGIIFQFFNLIPSLTAAGNIEFPMNITRVPKIQRKKRVQELLQKVGLENRARHRPFTLSGGEKQRIAIAQAFANDPSLILADEPTGNIDSVSAEKIMRIFAQTLKENPDKAVIIVTHDPAFRKIADKTLVLRDGEIIRELGKTTDNNDNTKSSGLINDNHETDENERILTLNDRHSLAKDVINELKYFTPFESIIECPKCNSRTILKNYDGKRGPLSIHGQQIIGRVAIACFDCQTIYYQTVTIFNVKKDLISN